jgi:hypothetical protein
MRTLLTVLLRAWRTWRYRHYLELDAPQRPDRMQVRYLKPGMTIRNMEIRGDDPAILDLVHVSPVDAELMVTLTAVQGVVRVCLDTWADIYTDEDADLEASLLIEDEQERPEA